MTADCSAPFGAIASGDPDGNLDLRLTSCRFTSQGLLLGHGLRQVNNLSDSRIGRRHRQTRLEECMQIFGKRLLPHSRAAGRHARWACHLDRARSWGSSGPPCFPRTGSTECLFNVEIGFHVYQVTRAFRHVASCPVSRHRRGGMRGLSDRRLARDTPDVALEQPHHFDAGADRPAGAHCCLWQADRREKLDRLITIVFPRGEMRELP